ncbi:hypothetical protein DPMN_148696 [Dreissena polymorpha]|uniref:Uncharacterized protein n=2 Tax=Dreissena polymorpha TaxID=45954 RepID=A0A9D4FCD5_DREPO|nr:hypothetical protein DPMN_148696 [Dreissena polymorpha]
MDHELQSPQGVHVTPAGQVLVCGYASNTVIQVDREGKKKLATIASQTDGMSYPKSVCYNTITDQIIVAINDNIMVIDLQ